MKALRLEEVSHNYGQVQAVDDLTLDIAPGELVCLLGPSGCGKTTALRIAAGLERLQQGRVYLDDVLVADGSKQLPPEERSVGLVFQDYALFPHLSVLENVTFGLQESPAAERQSRAREALRQVGMSRYDRAYPHQLSGGQQQRVALARALAPSPRLMLLDEPFSGLDLGLRQEVRDQALKDNGAACLMVTHDPEEAMFMADRIAIMREGRLEQLGTPSELYFQPRNAFVAGFFGDINRIPGMVRDDGVATPIGLFPAEGLADGTPVDVLVRPEALTISSHGIADAKALVSAARLLGRTTLVHLNAMGEEGEQVHLHARIPGRRLPRPGEEVTLAVDQAQSFVFPRNAAE